MATLFANNGDPHQTPHSAVSDLGLHYLPITLLGISKLKLVKHRVIVIKRHNKNQKYKIYVR